MNSRVHPKYKTKYRVSNWAEYDRALVQRGGATLWISPNAADSWTPEPSGRRVRKVGRRQCKKGSGYHKQARVENTFFGYQSIVGDRLRARHPNSQEAEALITCNILNRMTEIGRPESFAIGP